MPLNFCLIQQLLGFSSSLLFVSDEVLSAGLSARSAPILPATATGCCRSLAEPGRKELCIPPLGSIPSVSIFNPPPPPPSHVAMQPQSPSLPSSSLLTPTSTKYTF